MLTRTCYVIAASSVDQAACYAEVFYTTPVQSRCLVYRLRPASWPIQGAVAVPNRWMQIHLGDISAVVVAEGSNHLTIGLGGTALIQHLTERLGPPFFVPLPQGD